MVEYLLLLLVCNNVDGDCTWTRAGRWPTEQVCLMKGLEKTEPPGSQFKCVMQQKAAGPDQMPLPRSRPKLETD